MDLGTEYSNANDHKIFDENLNFDLRNIGISHGVQDVGEGLKAQIFLGASLVELGFTGVGKSQGKNAPSPETYGKDEREELRQLAKINEVEVSVHATPSLGALSGFDGQRGFSKQAAQQHIDEVKRAIEFAADVAEGGPVVVHTGEFPRPLFSVEETGDHFRAPVPDGDRFKHLKEEDRHAFQLYKGEAQQSPEYLVDSQTGQIIDAVKRDEKVYLPVYEKDADGNEITKTDPKTGKRLPLYQVDPTTNEIQLKETTFGDYAARDKYKDIKDFGIIARDFFKEQKATELERAKGQADEYELMYQDSREKYEKISKQLDGFKERKAEIDKNFDAETAKRKWEELRLPMKDEGGFSAAESVDPIEYLEKAQQQALKRMSYGSEVAIGSRKQIAEAGKQLDRVETIKEYGIKASAQSFADAAMYAYEVEKKKGLEKPLFVAPEAWLPEMYGSHPKEMKELILASRKEMQEKLLERGMANNESEAKKIADNHIKGTFDIGHLNNWRKHFQGSDEDFNKWVVKNMGELFKEGIMDNVHISDNFGYHDEHLRPGEGNAPIKEFLKELEKQGYKGHIIAEPGGQKQGQFHTPWTSALGMNNSPIYRVSDGTSRAWTDVQGSYFGRTSAPSYIVGDFAPSKEWTLWSQLPLE
ncbi:MAG: TIM barrel protein [Nanoarchaeota archaeon]|nr:TIM barrel protein [Nanoarchaeota archaeon]